MVGGGHSVARGNGSTTTTTSAAAAVSNNIQFETWERLFQAASSIVTSYYHRVQELRWRESSFYFPDSFINHQIFASMK